MAECQLPKLDVASSSLVSRSPAVHTISWSRTQVAKGAVCKTAIHQFDSGRLLPLLPTFRQLFKRYPRRTHFPHHDTRRMIRKPRRNLLLCPRT